MAKGNFNTGPAHGGYKHGMYSTTTYKSWQSMKSRCVLESDPSYNRYGGRGITYDPSWESFENFLEDMGKRPDGTTLDRKDNNGPYCKDNCRWATIKDQTRNRRDNHNLEFNGKSQCLLDWAAELGMPRTTLNNRISRGWDVERALTTPVKRRNYA